MDATNESQVPARRRRGRPTKMTPERVARILGAVRCGAPDHVACSAAGISQSTLGLWISRAQDPDAPKRYWKFMRKLAAARDEGNVARLAIIQKSAQTDWRAAAWMLERVLPGHFSARHHVEHSGSIRQDVELNAKTAELLGSIPGLLDALDDIAHGREPGPVGPLQPPAEPGGDAP